jgi:hypothetical protein
VPPPAPPPFFGDDGDYSMGDASLFAFDLGAKRDRLDFIADGRIDITDFGQFSVRFFTMLP